MKITDERGLVNSQIVRPKVEVSPKGFVLIEPDDPSRGVWSAEQFVERERLVASEAERVQVTTRQGGRHHALQSTWVAQRYGAAGGRSTAFGRPIGLCGWGRYGDGLVKGGRPFAMRVVCVEGMLRAR